jgi:hypothetical protein
MWLVGIVVLLLVACGLSLLLGRLRDEARTEIWDIVGTARTYTSIVGTLAGFSVTSTIFIASLSAPQRSAAFESLMALFLIAFLIFIGAAMQFGTTPNLISVPSDEYRTIQGYSYLLANSSYYLGLSLSWLGLPLLLYAMGLDYLGGIVIWLVLFAIVGGGMRICGAGLYNFVGINLPASLTLPLVGFALAALYSLALGRGIPDLLPLEHGPTLFATLCFAIAAVGLAIQSIVVGSLRREASAAAIARVADRIVLSYVAAVVTTSSLLWLAVASAVRAPAF